MFHRQRQLKHQQQDILKPPHYGEHWVVLQQMQQEVRKDGHIVLSRHQTQLGIYPAVDITASVSRVMSDITPPRQQAAAMRFRRLVSLYLENRDLMLMGGYQSGQDPDLDLAVSLWPKLTGFIKQAPNEPAGFAESQKDLIAMMEG